MGAGHATRERDRKTGTGPTRTAIAPAAASGSARGSPRIRFPAWLLALLVALTPACRRIPPPDLPADPAVLLGEVVRAQAAVTSVEGQARVRIDARGFDGTLTHFIAAEKPDRLHLETLDFFGNVVAVLVSSGDRFSLYDAREKVLYRGRPTPENVARIVPIAVDPRALVTILCGSAPLLDGTPAEVEPGDGTVRLVIHGGDRRQALEIGPAAAVERSRVRLVGGDGAITDAPAPDTVDLRFDVFRRWGGARFPTDLHLVSGDPAAKIDLHWTEVEVNRPVDPDLFVLEPPRGARVVDLDDAG